MISAAKPERWTLKRVGAVIQTIYAPDAPETNRLAHADACLATEVIDVKPSDESKQTGVQQDHPGCVGLEN